MSVEPRRPRLLPQNRKLRHLNGLSLRNLSFAPPRVLRTADDADLIVHKNTQKLEPLREAGALQSSRSSDNLRRDSLHSDQEGGARPQQARRTSLSLAHWNLGTRQKKLEEVVDTTVGDVFFTAHVSGQGEPVYVSEVKHMSANFDFQFFDLGAATSNVSRACKLTIRVWSKRPKHDSWTFLLEELVDLRQLHFIGTLIDRQYPPNSLIFHLEDGLYSLDFPTRAAEPRQAPQVPTSSYSTLMKLANLENSIEDAIETQRVIMRQINDLLEQTPTSGVDAAEEEVAVANKYVAAQLRVNRQTEKRRDELHKSLESRRQAIAQGREAQLKAAQEIATNRTKLESSTELVKQMDVDIRGQRRRICSELSDVFPISPVANAPPLSFQICQIHLPNSVYDAAIARTLSEDALSAGLGLVALLVKHLQFYLSHPLPYNIIHYGSRSYIQDEISHLDDKSVGRREFPLFLPRGGSTSGQWRFEYAWFLLNKDIEALCSSQSLRIVDIRHTLANLKYLLYVCSAGTDEVPERKKGGVRGLWAGRLKGRLPSGLTDVDGSSASSSRPGSADSEALSQRGDALRNAAWQDRLSLPFDEADGISFRTKGLRENLAN